MFRDIIDKLIRKEDILRQEAAMMMTEIMEGKSTPAQIGAFLTALRMKGETVEEITGCAMVMREKADRIYPKVAYSIDTCGTGGDASGTFNISTAAALVTAAGGVPVAKHGNRSVTSSSGSADVLEALGVRIDIPHHRVKECIEVTGLGFMFAPAYHLAMKHAIGPRRDLGIRTIFNIIGPLTNPAGAKGQVLGVFDPALTEPLAGVLRNLDIDHALVVHGEDGLDEFTVTASTRVSELKAGEICTYSVAPEEFGLRRADIRDLLGGDPKENAEIIRRILRGEKGPKRDIVVLNSGAALYVGKAAGSIEEGVQLACNLIDSGRALDKLNEFIKMTSLAA